MGGARMIQTIATGRVCSCVRFNVARIDRCNDDMIGCCCAALWTLPLLGPTLSYTMLPTAEAVGMHCSEVAELFSMYMLCLCLFFQFEFPGVGRLLFCTIGVRLSRLGSRAVR